MRIGTYFGIPLKVNPFFFLFVAAAFYCGKLREALVLLAIVLWHESFHVLVAKAYQLEIIDIELLPFGGVARLGALLQLNPGLEWMIAIAGPLSNVLLAFLTRGFGSQLSVPGHWLDFIVRANLGMAAFNLLPALPLDGGRVLRSFLVGRLGYKKATARIVKVGQALAVFLSLWGAVRLYFQQYNAVIFIVVGIMLFWSARQESLNASYIFMRYLTHKKREMRLKRVVAGRYLVSTAETSLGEVLELFQPPLYHLVWVLDLEGSILGFLGELELIEAVFEHGTACKMGTLVPRR